MSHREQLISVAHGRGNQGKMYAKYWGLPLCVGTTPAVTRPFVFGPRAAACSFNIDTGVTTLDSPISSGQKSSAHMNPSQKSRSAKIGRWSDIRKGLRLGLLIGSFVCVQQLVLHQQSFLPNSRTRRSGYRPSDEVYWVDGPLPIECPVLQEAKHVESTLGHSPTGSP